MKIGLLAYHSVCNFGAFLQLLSTVEYLRNIGEEPIVINWIPEDLENDYIKRSTKEVRDLFLKLRIQYYPLTSLCRTAKDIANVIEKEIIEAVIIGSDAVCQHHPFRERFHFPTKRIFYIAHPTSDRMFPNPFWGTFNRYLSHPVPIAMISGSSQNSKFMYINGKTKHLMAEMIKTFSYYSVRDEWTQKMIKYITDDFIIPNITPDPVFAFNYNVHELIPSKNKLINHFSLPEKYVLISFKGQSSVNQEWITSFESICNNNGLACVNLPYPDFLAFGNCQYSVPNTLSPLDWYGLIKYSYGYVGNNMHPIVVSLHNNIPFYSFDNYGIKNQEESSKIYHILQTANLLQYRTFINGKSYVPPTPLEVFISLRDFDYDKSKSFSDSYFYEYKTMMDNVLKSIRK